MKLAAIVAGIGTAVLSLGALYLSYKREQKNQGEELNEEEQLQRQIEDLKKRIDVDNLSLDDVKEVFEFSIRKTKKKVVHESLLFQKKRRMHTKEQRMENMGDYLNTLSEGLASLNDISKNYQEYIFQQIGIDMNSLMKYQQEIGVFMQEQLMKMQHNENIKQMSLEEVKNAIKLCTEYAKKQGNLIIEKIIHATESWTEQKKKQILFFLHFVIEDGAFENHPEIDSQALQLSQLKLQKYIGNQMAKYQTEYKTLNSKLMDAFKLNNNPANGGMDMDMDMGLQGNGMMEQLQMLKELSKNNPQEFQELMRNMYG